jgi:hypothetical protein
MDVDPVTARLDLAELRWALARNRQRAGGLALASASVSRIGATVGPRVLEEVGPSLVWVLGYHLLGRWGGNQRLVVATAAMVPAFGLAAALLSGDALVACELAVTGVLLAAAMAPTAEVTW